MDLLLKEVPATSLIVAIDPGKAYHRVWVTSGERGLPVTTPARTLIDLSLRFGDDPLEKAINEADRRDLLDPERLRDELDLRPGVPGAPRLRRLLDRRTFRLIDSQLERRFLPLARRAGLPPPLTRRIVNGYRVDFFWRALGLVDPSGNTFRQIGRNPTRGGESPGSGAEG